MKTIVQLVEEQKEYFLEKDTAAKQAVEANIAPVEADPSSASRAYVVGEQLFLNDVLYDVTSPISVGDAIVVGTNITAANKLSADFKSKIDDLYSKNQAFMKQITVNGAVNELDHTGVTDTSGTVKLTVNEDKSITVSANSYPVTLDSTTTFFFFGTASAAVPNIFKGKKFVGCPSGGASGTYRIIIQEFSSTTPSGAIAESSDIGEGANISTGDYIRMYIRLGSGYQLTSALTFKPMISLPELGLSYDDYVPYAKTNRQLTEDSVTWDDLSEVGAVNYCNFDTASRTKKGYTFTNNKGVVHVTGSRTSGETGNIDFNKTISLKAGTYKLTGCPSGGSDDTWRLLLNINNSAQYSFDYGDGAEFTLSADSDNVKIYCTIMSAYSDSVDMYFKPMIADADYSGGYVPYAKTNRELTEEATPQEVAYTINSSIVSASPRLKLYKTGKEIVSTGYITTSAAAARSDTLFTITNERPKDEYEYFLMVNSSGNTILTRFNSDGTVKVDVDSMPAGGYIVFGTLILE